MSPYFFIWNNPKSFRQLDLKLFAKTKALKIKNGLSLLLWLSVSYASLSLAEHHLGQADGETEVYSYFSKLYLHSIPANTPTNVISQDGIWSFVQFDGAVIPTWVSKDYVRIVGGLAVVTADQLNARIQPDTRAKVLGQIDSGYRAEVLSERNGFYQVYAPSSFRFALKRKDIGKAEQGKVAAKKAPESWSFNVGEDVGNNVTENIVDDINGNTDDDANENVGNELSIPEFNSPIENAAQESSAINLSNIETDSPASVQTQQQVPTVSSPIDANKQHRLAPGDSITLTVFGEADLGIENTRIPQSGRVSFPLIGSIMVANSSLAELEQKLIGEYSQGYIKNPRLSIVVESYRPIYVLGSVTNPGAIEYAEGLTVAQVLSLSGGALQNAKQNGIQLKRNGIVIANDLSFTAQDTVLSGDILTVQEETGASVVSQSFVYLHGEVNRPGAFKYRRGLSVEKAVVLAGGFSLRASRKKISITREVEGQDQPIKLNKVDLFAPVLPGDIINVGARWF